MAEFSDLPWENQVLDAIKNFAAQYSVVYTKNERALSAYFEIGCFLTLVKFYEKSGFNGQVMNPSKKDGCYKVMLLPGGDQKVQKFYESCGMKSGMKTAFLERWETT